MQNHSLSCSVILNVHRDAAWLTGAFNSLYSSIKHASDHGLTCELLLVADSPDSRTTTLAEHLKKTFTDIELSLIYVEHRSLGPARNSGISAARGRFILTADADDLVGETYIRKMIRAAERSEFRHFALYPEFILSFGARSFLSRYISSFYFSPADMLVNNPYCSRLIAPRETLIKFSYGDFGLGSQWSYEDWELSLRLVSEGGMLGVCENAVLFYRERADSLAKKAHAQGGLIQANRFHDADFLLERHQNFLGRFSSERYLEQVRERFHDRQATLKFLDTNDWFADEVAKANSLEPQIDLRGLLSNPIWCPLPFHTGERNWGWCLLEVLKLLEDSKITDVFLVPNLDPGGAERYLLNVAKAFHHHAPGTCALFIANTKESADLWAANLPHFIQFVNLGQRFPLLGSEDHIELAVRLIQILARKLDATLRVHLKPSPFAHALVLRYGSPLSGISQMLYYRFSNPVTFYGDRLLEDPFATNFLQTVGHFIDVLVCDNQTIIDKDTSMVDATKRGYFFLPALLGDMESPVYLAVTPGNLYRQSASKRLLWASRLSKEKRPTLLGPLAKQLQSECPGVTIECWGSGDESALGAERPDNLRFRGAFDHPLDLPFSEYDAFLYTSLYDGMPNIVVEALSQGIIVIASDVGAISHYIEDGSSGYLIQQSGDDFIDATRFTASIKRLYARWETTATMARNGQQKAAPHLLEAYLKHTENLLEFLAQCSAKTAIPLV